MKQIGRNSIFTGLAYDILGSLLQALGVWSREPRIS